MQIQIPSLELQRDMVTQCHGVDHVEHEVPVREDGSVGLEPKTEVKLETWELAQKWCYIHGRGCPYPRRVGRWRCGLAAFALCLTSRRFSLAYAVLSKYLNLWPAFKNQDISRNSAGFWISSERPKGLATRGHFFCLAAVCAVVGWRLPPSGGTCIYLPICQPFYWTCLHKS